MIPPAFPHQEIIFGTWGLWICLGCCSTYTFLSKWGVVGGYLSPKVIEGGFPTPNCQEVVKKHGRVMEKWSTWVSRVGFFYLWYILCNFGIFMDLFWSNSSATRHILIGTHAMMTWEFMRSILSEKKLKGRKFWTFQGGRRTLFFLHVGGPISLILTLFDLKFWGIFLICSSMILQWLWRLCIAWSSWNGAY